MPKSRHPHRIDLPALSRRSPLIVAILASTLFVSGCFQEPTPPRNFVPGDPLYEQFTSQGDRIVVDADDDALAIKLRQRRHTIRVFDHQMIPVGRIRIDDDTVERRSLDGTRRSTAEWIDDDTAHLPGGWRLERADDGWDVFADDTVVALLRRDDDHRWMLRPTRGDVTTLTADDDETSARVVDDDGRTILRTDLDVFSSPLALLTLAIAELSPLDRKTLAAFAELHRCDRLRSPLKPPRFCLS